MNERMENILKLAVGYNIDTLRGFKQGEEHNTYLIRSDLSELHKVWLWYELSDEFLRIEITYIFGEFELHKGFNPGYLIFLLVANNPSFRNSCAYVGAKKKDKEEQEPFITLQTSQVFLSKWSDEDIAHALAVKFFDLMSGLMFEFPEPKPIKIFGAQ